MWAEVDQFANPVHWWQWSPRIHSTHKIRVDEQEFFYIPDGTYTVTLGATGPEACRTRFIRISWLNIVPVVRPSVWCGARVETEPDEPSAYAGSPLDASRRAKASWPEGPSV